MKAKELSYILFTTFMLLFGGCASHDELLTVRFNVDKMSDMGDGKLIKKVSLISLQTPKVVMGEIVKIADLDTLVYLLDRGQEAVHIFSKSGRYVNTIAAKGHGPAEYISIADFFADAGDGTVKILDRQGSFCLSTRKANGW